MFSHLHLHLKWGAVEDLSDQETVNITQHNKKLSGNRNNSLRGKEYTVKEKQSIVRELKKGT